MLVKVMAKACLADNSIKSIFNDKYKIVNIVFYSKSSGFGRDGMAP